MNRLFITAAVILFISLCTLTGCNRYVVTLNERIISEPAAISISFTVEDPALAACIAQTIKDQQLKSTDQLFTLICTHTGIKSLEGIQAFSGLQTINLAQNELSSISPLLFLSNLKSVNLQDNTQIECSGIQQLQQHIPEEGTLLPPEQCMDK